MPTHPLPAQPIAGILADELAQLRAFVALLKQEQSTLVEGKSDELPTLIEKKSALAARLTDCATRREAAMAALQLPAGREGMETWLGKGTSIEADDRKNWQALLPLAAEARTLNELNGKLINSRLQHNQQALAALMAATNQAMTYGPDGQTRPFGGSRSFGSI